MAALKLSFWGGGGGGGEGIEICCDNGSPCTLGGVGLLTEALGPFLAH